MKHPLVPALFLLSVLTAGCYYDKASELYPAGTCNTTDVRYSNVIRPILDANCSISGCHNSATVAGGYNLADYAGVKIAANNGTLTGSVAHAGGYSPMPKDRAKLPDCQINQIRAWVDAGALNN